jgi:hypothetical protein
VIHPTLQDLCSLGALRRLLSWGFGPLRQTCYVSFSFSGKEEKPTVTVLHKIRPIVYGFFQDNGSSWNKKKNPAVATALCSKFILLGKWCCLKIPFKNILFCFGNYAYLLLYAAIKEEEEACQVGPKIRSKREL